MSQTANIPSDVPPMEPTDTESTQNQAQTAPGIDYEAEIAKYKDNWLRAAAEIENVKRRARQDIERAGSSSIENFAKDLIRVLDYLYSASDAITEEAAATHESLRSAKEGIDITKKELLNAFEKNALKRLYPKGEKFDHNFHQAVAQVESDQASDTIVDVLQAGYVMKERLLRPAMVTVAKAKA